MDRKAKEHIILARMQHIEEFSDILIDILIGLLF